MEFRLPAEFTPAQFERLRELVAVAESTTRAPEDHNLARKLDAYCSTARSLEQRFPRVGTG
jgi:hypothetical protein